MADFDFSVVPITVTAPPKKPQKKKEESDQPPKRKRDEKEMGVQLRAAFVDKKNSLAGFNKKDKRYWKDQVPATQPKEEESNDNEVEVVENPYTQENGEEEGEQQPAAKKRRFMDAKERTQQWNPSMAEVKQIKLETPEMFNEVEFDSFKLSDRLLKHLKEGMQLQKPTHIQRAAVPSIMEGNDVLMKAETGSGKTLAFLLPMVNALGTIEPRIDRSAGAYGIVISPTRELAQQTYEVLQRVLKPFHWIIPGYLTGGENKNAEKRRLRKGNHIVVATPGRLLDHLKTTQSFKYDSLKWLVLDEADRLLDMGFGPQVSEIVSIVLSRERGYRADQAKPKNATLQTVLASATLHDGIRKLAFIALNNPVYVGLATENTKKIKQEEGTEAAPTIDFESYNTPKQLQQNYAIIPAKERLASLLGFLASKTKGDTPCKAVLFVSNCDSVELFYHLLNVFNKKNNLKTEEEKDEAIVSKDGSAVNRRVGTKAGKKKEEDQKAKGPSEIEKPIANDKTFVLREYFDIDVLKLHGNMPQSERTAAYSAFKKQTRSLLISTDVAARGLDLPDINWIIQYDPPSDTKDYVHRVGRTARMGRAGQSLLFVLPEESTYIKHLHEANLTLLPLSIKFDHKLQLNLERYVLSNPPVQQMSRQAYFSSVRAYATHTKETKHIFRVANLHMGHIAKSFALRETPTTSLNIVRNTHKKENKKEKVETKQQTVKSGFRSQKREKKLRTDEFDTGF